MEKKESPKSLKKEAAASGAPPKVPGLSAKAFNVIKFILGVCLLPFVYSITYAFLNEFYVIDRASQYSFWAGVVTIVIIYLFVWEPLVIYTKGQRILEMVFCFFQPFVKVAPYLLPIYTVLLFLLYGICTLFLKPENILGYFVFMFGFSLGLHLIFSAKSLRSKQGDFLKGNYIFGFSFVYIINLSLFALGLNFVYEKFSIVSFSNTAYLIASDIFKAVFGQLFF